MCIFVHKLQKVLELIHIFVLFCRLCTTLHVLLFHSWESWQTATACCQTALHLLPIQKLHHHRYNTFKSCDMNITNYYINKWGQPYHKIVT